MFAFEVSPAALMRDLGYVHGVGEQIRAAAADVVESPLDEDAGNALWLLLMVEAAAARAVLARVETLQHVSADGEEAGESVTMTEVATQ
ncbi:hypothetical protein [Antrihabitans spumae]|jgi:hypothetical protein|uniref:Uncharacterized protein n=1 Tax=Antrihabitans spumae TaxID=3373370 RepID=A0ABW7KGL9_9NOCA